MTTALVLVDVVNAFFDPRGVNYHASYEALRSTINQLVEAALDGGSTVIHALERHRPGPDSEWAKLPQHCIEGSWEATVPAWLVRQADHVIVAKRRYSAFFATDLDLLLRERNVRRLVVAGVKSHVCVRATIQDAFALGYDVLLPREATSSNRRHLHEASLEDIERYLGRVVPLSAALQAFRDGAVQ